MKNFILSLPALFAAGIVSAQTVYIPPDFYQEDYKRSIGFWENKGQVITTEGHKTKDVRFYSEGGTPRAYLRDRSTVSFVMAHVDTVLATADTLWRLDMRPFGAHAQPVSPVGFVLKDWTQNFYLPWCGDSGIADVTGSCRVVYPNIYNKIDMHFYSGSAGQKLAFVMRPGCNPNELKLAFTGQDSIKVDLWGTLKIYYNGKYMEMPFAQAYQVGAGNAIIPVGWVPNYSVNNGTGVVSFQYSSYDPALPLVFQVGPPPMAADAYEEVGLCWSTYFGGDGATTIHESAKDIGNRYFVGGWTASTWLAFPTNNGQTTIPVGTVSFASGFDIGEQLQWTTFLGGATSSGCQTHGLVAANGGIYVGGNTYSSSFYTQQPNSLAYYQPTNTSPGSKAFLAKLNPGNGHVGLSTYLGTGSGALSGMSWSKYLYITGSTYGTLPAVQAPFSTATYPYSGGEDGFLVILDDQDRTCYATFLGGSDSDRPVEVRAGTVNGQVRVVLAGITGSAAIQSVPCSGNTFCLPWSGSSQETMLMEFNQYGALLWSTYLGYSSPLWDSALALDPLTGDVVVAPYAGVGVSVVPGPGWHQDEDVGVSSCLARFAGADRSLIWLTYVHGEVDNNQLPEVHVRSLHFDADGFLYVGGHAFGYGLPMQTVPDEYVQSTPYLNSASPGGQLTMPGDAFALRFTPAQVLDWGAYFGGNGVGYDMYSEVVYTLLARNGGLYAGGVHSKSMEATTSFFPLDEGGWTNPYFNDVHQGGPQGFLVNFCAETSIGVSEQPTATNRLSAVGTGAGILVHGVAPGPHQLTLHDALGRSVTQQQLRSAGSALLLPGTSGLSTGMYILHVDGGEFVKVWIGAR